MDKAEPQQRKVADSENDMTCCNFARLGNPGVQRSYVETRLTPSVNDCDLSFGFSDPVINGGGDAPDVNRREEKRTAKCPDVGTALEEIIKEQCANTGRKRPEYNE